MECSFYYSLGHSLFFLGGGATIQIHHKHLECIHRNQSSGVKFSFLFQCIWHLVLIGTYTGLHTA